jgi:hypothetical protein
VALPLAVFWVANLLFYGFGEEIGWRGFAQPTLQRKHSALRAAIIVSAIWAAWHLPLFGITATYRAMPAIGFAGFYFSLLTSALVLAWLYLRSRRSILVVAVFHAAYDIATTTPTTTTLIPTVMGVAITVAGLAVIPSLARTRRTDLAEPPTEQHPLPMSPSEPAWSDPRILVGRAVGYLPCHRPAAAKTLGGTYRGRRGLCHEHHDRRRA